MTGPLITMDYFLLILTLFNPPIHHGQLLAIQSGQTLCFVTLLLGGLSGLVLGPYITFLILDFILFIQQRWIRYILYGGLITGFGIPLIIQVTAITKFFDTLFERFRENENENCNHTVLCDCKTWNSMVNRLVEDFYHWNHDSQFWNPLNWIQFGFPGIFIGGVISFFLHVLKL
eukprot:gene10078-2499_t